MTTKDSNLTPAQRVWKARRARWSAFRAVHARPSLTWQQALQQGKEREFLKREGEGD